MGKSKDDMQKQKQMAAKTDDLMLFKEVFITSVPFQVPTHNNAGYTYAKWWEENGPKSAKRFRVTGE